MSKVTIVPVKGKVINVSSNPEYGYMRVESNAIVFTNGFARNTKRSALINGKIADLEAMGAHAGMELPGKIRVIDSLEATHPKNAESEAKTAGEDGPALLSDGAQIFSSSEFTTDMDAADVKIAHTNVEEVTTFNKSQAKVKFEA